MTAGATPPPGDGSRPVSHPVGPEAAPGARLSIAQKLTYSLPQVGINITGIMIAQWLTYFYLPPEGGTRPRLVSAAVFAGLMFAGRLVDAVADPLIGYWSDRTRSRWGRRMPFIVLGTPLLAVSFAAIWFPPFAPGSIGNAAWLGAVLFAYWAAFTAVVAPYTALLPEIAVSIRERIRLSSVMALFIAAGTLAGTAVGPLNASFPDRYPDGISLPGLHIGSGIQAFALFATIVMVVTFYVMPLNIRETPHGPSKEVPAGMVSGVLSTFRNKAFLAFLGISVFVQMGTVMFVIGLPYFCTQVLERVEGQPGLVEAGSGETWAGILQGILFGVALLAIPAVNLVADRVGKKRLMLSAGAVLAAALFAVPAVTWFGDPAIPAIAVVAILGFPASCALVLANAIAADVVDWDERTTGVRREGIYTGAGALFAKTALGVATAVTVGLLALGSSREDPIGILLIGPVSAVFVAIGLAVFSIMPIEE